MALRAFFVCSSEFWKCKQSLLSGPFLKYVTRLGGGGGEGMFVNVTSCDRGDSDWLTSQCLSLYGRRRRPKYFCTNFKITFFIGKNGDGGTSFVTYSTSLGEGGGGGLSLET